MGWIIDYGPHIHCTSLDDNCLVAGFSCLLKDYLHQGLEEAPKNYSVPDCLYGEGNPSTPPGVWLRSKTVVLGMKTNKMCE